MRDEAPPRTGPSAEDKHANGVRPPACTRPEDLFRLLFGRFANHGVVLGRRVACGPNMLHPSVSSPKIAIRRHHRRSTQLHAPSTRVW